MFGMIYGGQICRKAGIPLESYVEQLPITLKMLPDYYHYFADSVAAWFESAQATMGSYGEALDDALASYKALEAWADCLSFSATLSKKASMQGCPKWP